MDINWIPTKLQWKAYDVLCDNQHTELLFGGSASVGKTRLLAYWTILKCLEHPGIRVLWGRSKLTSLKLTTVRTFLDICKEWNIVDKYNYNQMNNTIVFNNGSEIILKDLFHYPADPDYVSLGSLEITYACIDEAAEIDAKAYSILKSRLRYKHAEFNIIPKLLIVSNPTQGGWLYDEFYNKWKKNKLEDNKAVILGTPEDNPHNTEHYLKILRNLRGADYERLYKGNWDFADDTYNLFKYEWIQDAFGLEIKDSKDDIFLTVDCAFAGKDKTIITRWRGLQLEEIINIDKNDTMELVDLIKQLQIKWKIKRSHIIIDKGGPGQGVADLLPGSIGYIGNSSSLLKENYTNLRSQLYYKLSFLLNDYKISFKGVEDFRDKISKQLLSIKMYKVDGDGKQQITPKTQIKEFLGESPDIADALMMRMYFEIDKPQKITVQLV